jgi:hypothetical protein
MSIQATTVKIGTTEITYELWRTSAPPEYDGFGTMTLYDSGEENGERAYPGARPVRVRYVLIDVRHSEWQRGRYASGMYAAVESDDGPSAKDVEARVWNWLLKGSEREETS